MTPRPTWEEQVDAVTAVAGDFQKARIAAGVAIDTGVIDWPSDEVGSSDLNHLAVSLHATGELAALLQEPLTLVRYAQYQSALSSIRADSLS